MSAAGRAYREIIKTIPYQEGNSDGAISFPVENSGVIVSIQDTGTGSITGTIRALLPGDMAPIHLDYYGVDGVTYTKAFICSSKLEVCYSTTAGSILAVSVKFVDSTAVDLWNKQLLSGVKPTSESLQDIQHEIAALREVNDKMLNNIRYMTDLSEEGEHY